MQIPNQIEAMVIDTLPNLQYKVETKEGKQYIAYSSGKIRVNKVRINVGDRVVVVLDPHGGKATNRVIRRL